MSFRTLGIGGMINRALTGSSRSLLEQALYPKTDAGNRTLGPVLYGALYSGGTYLGFPKNYYNNYSQRSSNAKILYLNTMPYNRYGRYYSRYGRRYGRYRRRRPYYRRSY